jgi:hypothetical protein
MGRAPWGGSRRDGEADPLPAAEVKAENAFGEHRNEHETARDDRLDNRELRERERTVPSRDRSSVTQQKARRGHQRAPDGQRET